MILADHLKHPLTLKMTAACASETLATQSTVKGANTPNENNISNESL
jgi:hypothetical protein